MAEKFWNDMGMMTMMKLNLILMCTIMCTFGNNILFHCFRCVLPTGWGIHDMQRYMIWWLWMSVYQNCSLYQASHNPLLWLTCSSGTSGLRGIMYQFFSWEYLLLPWRKTDDLALCQSFWGHICEITCQSWDCQSVDHDWVTSYNELHKKWSCTVQSLKSGFCSLWSKAVQQGQI